MASVDKNAQQDNSTKASDALQPRAGTNVSAADQQSAQKPPATQPPKPDPVALIRQAREVFVVLPNQNDATRDWVKRADAYLAAS